MAMELQHSFHVPVGLDRAWEVLLDVERIGPCMPGATIDSVDGDAFTATVKVKLGPMGLTYKSKATFVEKDAAAHRLVIEARSRDARGNGTANATVTAILSGDESGTDVLVTTDLDVTGKPAQFGRGMLAEVGEKLIGQFADSLARLIEDEHLTASNDGGGTQAMGLAPKVVPRPNDPIDLGSTFLPAAVRRMAPYAVVTVLVLVVRRLVRWSASHSSANAVRRRQARGGVGARPR
jgi:carbon monoxide dehydrogenase subunit G